MRTSVISVLRKSGRLRLTPPLERLSEEDLERVAKISDFLDERALPYTKSILCAELGVEVDLLSRRGLRKRSGTSGISAAVQTISNSFKHAPVVTQPDRRELERREKILDLEQQELRVREVAL